VYGCEPDAISLSLSAFSGIEHRLEFVTEKKGLRFYNDSAATIPEATRVALESVTPPITLITGGTDKNLDFSALGQALEIPNRIVLLRGSATEKIQELLDKYNISYRGPFDTLQQSLVCAVEGSAPNTAVLFSPGCASFELFLNEFDRGRRFKNLVWAL
jgi:UDP-N-acetylmuramoylalanine--D-glutamate ligase